jgi:hypothetical protein
VGRSKWASVRYQVFHAGVTDSRCVISANRDGAVAEEMQTTGRHGNETDLLRGWYVPFKGVVHFQGCNGLWWKSSNPKTSVYRTMSEEHYDLAKEIAEMKSDFKSHAQVTDIIMKNNLNILQDIRSDLKEYKLNTDQTIYDMREHFDDRISSCTSKVLDKLRDDYYSKDQIEHIRRDHVAEGEKVRRDEITKAVLAVEKRIENKMHLIWKIVSTVILVIVGIIQYGGHFIK